LTFAFVQIYSTAVISEEDIFPFRKKGVHGIYKCRQKDEGNG
jgi:hypothetical protein